MAEKLMYNDDTQNYPFNRLKFVVETFGHLIQWTNLSKFNKISQSGKKTILLN